jgi:hypothetical protein
MNINKLNKGMVRRCSKGEGNWHKPSSSCKKSCKKTRGPGFRRSRKSPYPCVPVKSGKGGKMYAFQKQYAGGKIVSFMKSKFSKKNPKPRSRSASSRSRSASASSPSASSRSPSAASAALPHFPKIASGLKLPIGSKFTTPNGTYERVSKNVSSSGVKKIS